MRRQPPSGGGSQVMSTRGVAPMDEKRQVLRHFLAALAYRTQKALRDAPPDFGASARRPESALRQSWCVT